MCIPIYIVHVSLRHGRRKRWRERERERERSDMLRCIKAGSTKIAAKICNIFGIDSKKYKGVIDQTSIH